MTTDWVVRHARSNPALTIWTVFAGIGAVVVKAASIIF